MSADAWCTLRLPARDADVAGLEAALDAQGALAVTIEAGDERPLFDTLDGSEPALWTQCTVEALFPADVDLDAVLAALAGAGLPTLGARRASVADQDWQGAFRAHFGPRAFGPLWVVPGWHTPPPAARLVMRLDPGMAFGTGTHPTTAMCLEWLATQASVARRRVLDYGCGSGILAIGAALLGAREIAAVDLDPLACEVARENAARNACTGIAIGLPGDLRAGEFDVLVANLLLQPVLALVDEFARRLPPGGQLALSGLMADQVPRVVAAYAPAFVLAPAVLRDEWALLTGVRRC
ncbi:MAG: 50S ribosomal protein L11 methyltransferase [Gammaproteobacteria bacterium]